MQPAQRSAWRPWWPFVLLCLLGGSRWILSESLPGTATTFATASLGCGSAAAIYLLLLRPSGIAREPRGQLARSAVSGALMIAGPLLGLLRPAGVPAASLTIALALTPVVIAVAEAATLHANHTLAGRLWPGLAAIAGLLLLLTQPSLSNIADDMILTLAPLLTGCGAVLFCSSRESVWRLPAALLGACLALGLGAAINLLTHTGGWTALDGIAAGLDALQALLSVIAIGRLSAPRWSAQFALIPFIVLIQGIALMGARVPARMLVGLLLLVFAGIALLIPPAEEPRFDLTASTPHTPRTD